MLRLLALLLLGVQATSPRTPDAPPRPSVAPPRPSTASPQSPGSLPQSVYPRGSRLPLGFYSLGYAGVRPESALAAGFDLAGPYYSGPTARNLAVQAEVSRAGFQLVQQLYMPYVNFEVNARPRSRWTESLRSRVEADVRAQVEALLADSALDQAVAWWTVSPEELDWRRPDEMEYLTLVTETIRRIETAHGHSPRPIGMYEPNGRTADAMAQTGARTDLIVRGAYVQFARKPRAWVRWAVGQMVEASARLPNHPAPVVVLQMSSDPAERSQWSRDTISAWIRHDVVAALVAGAKGILVWSAAPRPALQNTYQLWADAYLDAARLLTGTERIGDLFIDAERLSSCEATVRSGPDHVEFAIRGRVQVPSLGVACLRRGGRTWVVAVNSATAPVEARIGGLPEGLSAVPAWPGTPEFRFGSGALLVQFPPYGVGAWEVR